MVILGVILHAIGGFAAGSFYIPFKKVKQWAWESYWLVCGFFAWIIAPWVIAFITAGNPLTIIRQAPPGCLLSTYAFGFLWGIGGLTFGLSMRYLGMSLGYAIALGFCAVFGTLIPPLYNGTFGDLLSNASGLTTLAGIFISVIGIAICGFAGISKEKELSDEDKKKSIEEFNFAKGVCVAIFAGIMSSCIAFAIAAGKPIAEIAVQNNVPPIWQINPVLVVVLAGGFTTNFLWCIFLNFKNRTSKDYTNTRAPLTTNYIFSALAGVTWYLQFMFYGMGTTKMGKYDFSSWTIHMAFIIVFSNVWGLIFKEWKGSSRRTHQLIVTGIIVLIFSTICVGYGNYLASLGK